jgi:signal transduction histidine kinase
LFRDVSLRHKVPFNLSLAILFTGVLVAAVLIWRTYDDVRDQVLHDSVELGRVLSISLVASIKHDDPWQAYKILRAANGSGDEQERALVLVRPDGRVYVSSHPRRYPMGVRLDTLGPDAAVLSGHLRARGNLAEPVLGSVGDEQRPYVLFPVVEDGARRGILVMLYSGSVFWPARVRVASRVTVSTLVAILVMLPIAWYVGNRTVTPLLDLASRMGVVGRARVGQVEKIAVHGNDEIAQLARGFNQMLEELEEKENLERQVIVSERLAALGRVVAGVAHEVNNPLGGMLNAINTHRRFGQSDDLTERTISLLERGLHQIRDTVSALLVEARAGRHGLSPDDVEDVRMLVQPDASGRRVRLEWDNAIATRLPVPATPVRQMLINLALNAVQAASEGGRVGFRIAAVDGELNIRIENDGEPIPEEELGQLFEPFATDKPSGTGLGLWVTYQIVRQLEGEIVVVSEGGVTSFEVHLPLTLSAAA